MLRRCATGFFRRSYHFNAEANFFPPPEPPILFSLQKRSPPRSIGECRQIHAVLVTSQAISETHLTNTILHLYSRCGDLYRARLLFDQMPHTNVVAWTSMITAYVHHGCFADALRLFKEMLNSGERPNQYSLSVAIRACTILGFLELGLQIHGRIIRSGFDGDEFSGSSLVDMYFKVRGNAGDAKRVFTGLFRRDIVTWNVMISRFSEINCTAEVLRLISEMQAVDGLNPNDYTITSLLKCCCLVREVQQVHGLSVKLGSEVDVVLSSALVDSYWKCGNIGSSQRVFDLMAKKDTFVWSSIISGYAKHGSGEESVILFREMCRQGLRPDQHAFSSTLKACCETGNVQIGIQAHTKMIKNGYQSDCFIASVLCTLYAAHCHIYEAEKLFYRVAHKDIAAWNSMILGHAQIQGASTFCCIWVFRELCKTMLKPNGATFVAVLISCTDNSDLVTGVQIHAMIMKSTQSNETRVANAVIHMYSKCQAIDDARRVFKDITCKDEISWSSIIGTYQQNGLEYEALTLCKEMLADEMYLTNSSLPSCIAACSGITAIEVGKQLHSFVIKLGLNQDVYVGSSIIDMYSKCGNLERSKKAFSEQEVPTEVTMNALISGFGQHGKAIEAVEIFQEMENMNLVPNQITFLAVISACSHAGLVEESLLFFDLMQQKYKIKPQCEHYSCMVDALGRAGRLEEALQIIQNDGSVSAWRTLLSACRNYGDEKIAQKSAKKVMELDPSDHASHVFLSSLYSREGNWEESLKLRQTMADIGVKKYPGNSWLSIQR